MRPAGPLRPQRRWVGTPESAATARPFHILYALRWLRYGLLLCLVPLARALLAFDLPAFYAALGQSSLILLTVAGAALSLRRATAFWLEYDGLHCQTGIFFRTHQTYSPEALAALEIVRPPVCRLLGASRLVLYAKGATPRRPVALYLSRTDAAALADRLMPAAGDVSVFAPTGFERLSLVMLSANLLTSCAFAWMTLDRAEQFVALDLKAFAQQNFERLAALAARLLPAGVSAAATLLFLAGAFTFLRSFTHTFGFKVCRTGGVLLCRGGFFTKTERRILARAVTAVEVRRTPAARLLGRYPIYVTAGAFQGGDIPLMMVRRGAPYTPQALLPGYTPATEPLCQPARKSPLQYVWRPAAALALALGMTGVSALHLPGVLAALLLTDALLAALLVTALEGWRREGLAQYGRAVCLCACRRLTRFDVCVLTPDIAYRLFETPFSTAAGRCDVTLYLPCRKKYRVRGARKSQAGRMEFLL